ncbi:hypothetical protein ACU4GA_26465 [Methylobacterium oryzae CBMB20]
MISVVPSTRRVGDSVRVGSPAKVTSAWWPGSPVGRRVRVATISRMPGLSRRISVTVPLRTATGGGGASSLALDRGAGEGGPQGLGPGPAGRVAAA